MDDPVREARQELLRVGLLADVSTDGVVSDHILRSWRRSISGSVDSAQPSQRFEDVDTDSILCRAADPVLDRWQNQLADTGTSLFLSDRGGSIVARRTSDSSVRRKLDRLHAAEGFDYSEDSIGTNGLGTSMVERRALYIRGSEHYSDALATLACAAAPVCTPTGVVIGSISLGGPIEIANPLMLSLTREIGQQIEERLRAASRPQDLALAMSFLRFTNSKRPTVVMDHESILSNNPGLPYVNVSSHVALWEVLNAHDWSSGGSARIRLDGSAVEVMARRVLDGQRAHYVLHFADLDDVVDTLADVPDLGQLATAQVAAHAGQLIRVDGPSGSGRATAALDARRNRPGSVEPEQFIASSVDQVQWLRIAELLESGTDVLLRRVGDVIDSNADHLKRLIADHQRSLAAGERTSTLLITSCSESATDRIREILDEVEPTVRTHALSRSPERIPGLVKSILHDVDPDGRHTMSPAALQAFVQWTWPGNIGELAGTLTTLVSTVRAPVIERKHLPQHIQQAPPRRHLSLIESAERDAIIKALDAAKGNKSEAATLLGMGRTTLYRRLRRFGLDDDEGTL
ncbi:helix-turn-helix domain-containing protein [Williamsia soli]|uniref:helix-turn-helix domain-containing protein n=1 Tax=Williamsia soli TaxID=364929 RepID=UPI001A9F95FB|nr:helix-turn-helix domain-containing protein [Williamsia soli]